MLQTFYVQAKQTQFVHKNLSGDKSFSFAWQDGEANYTLAFSIDAEAFKAMPSTKAAFSNARLQREVEIALLRAAKDLDPRKGRVKVQRVANRLEYEVLSRSQDNANTIMQNLNDIKETARSAYLESHFYSHFITSSGVSTVKHDHLKYAQMSADALQPVVEAIKNLQQNPRNPREFIKIALSWLQSIPYNTLEDRRSSNGAGYLSPRDLMLRNQGDCDSKATLLMALMRAYASSLPQIMVLLPEHALLAIAIPPQKTDKTISHEGISYVLLEAAGPAYFKVGQAAKTTLRDIANRQYRIEAL